jgi:predicted RNA-binding protein YlqC (UPF0109 family)
MDSRRLGEEFVRTVLRGLVDRPEDLTVKSSIDEMGVLIEVHPHFDDIGRVIGKAGSTIDALRNIMRVLGKKHGAHYSVKVYEHA